MSVAGGLADVVVDGGALGALVDQRDVGRGAGVENVEGDDVADGHERATGGAENGLGVGFDRAERVFELRAEVGPEFQHDGHVSGPSARTSRGP